MLRNTNGDRREMLVCHTCCYKPHPFGYIEKANDFPHDPKQGRLITIKNKTFFYGGTLWHLITTKCCPSDLKGE